MTRVLLADDDYVIAEQFKSIIENLGHEVVAVAHNSEEAIAQAKELEPEVAFLDIRMDYREAGIHAANQIKDSFPKTKVYFLSSYNKDSFSAELVNSKYDGYIDKLNFSNVVADLLK